MDLKTLTFKGFIKEGEADKFDTIFIGETDEPIAKELEYAIDRKQVSVRYWISDVEKTKEQLQTSVLKNIVGAVDAEYTDRYSDITGYLWTDENLNIGGHDLLAELRSNKGKFIWLEIDIH